jgi:hypothetical protein
VQVAAEHVCKQQKQQGEAKTKEDAQQESKPRTGVEAEEDARGAREPPARVAERNLRERHTATA